MQLIILLIAVLSTNSSFAGSKIGLLVGGNLSHLQGSFTSTFLVPSNVPLDFQAKAGFGAGLLFEFPAGPKYSLEFDGIYNVRKIQLAGSPRLASTYIEIPIIFRCRLTPVFSIGLGGYYATAVGDPKNENTGAAYPRAGFFTVTDAFGAKVNFGDLKSSDYGLAGSLALAFKGGGKTSFFIDGRYYFGLAKQMEPNL